MQAATHPSRLRKEVGRCLSCATEGKDRPGAKPSCLAVCEDHKRAVICSVSSRVQGRVGLQDFVAVFSSCSSLQQLCSQDQSTSSCPFLSTECLPRDAMEPRDWKSVINKILKHLDSRRLSQDYWEPLPDNIIQQFELKPWLEARRLATYLPQMASS